MATLAEHEGAINSLFRECCVWPLESLLVEERHAGMPAGVREADRCAAWQVRFSQGASTTSGCLTHKSRSGRPGCPIVSHRVPSRPCAPARPSRSMTSCRAKPATMILTESHDKMACRRPQPVNQDTKPSRMWACFRAPLAYRIGHIEQQVPAASRYFQIFLDMFTHIYIYMSTVVPGFPATTRRSVVAQSFAFMNVVTACPGAPDCEWEALYARPHGKEIWATNTM